MIIRGFLLGLQLDLIVLPLDQLIEPEVFKLLSIVSHLSFVDAFEGRSDVTTHILPKGLLFTYLFEHGVEPVLDLVFCPADDFLGNLSPLVAYQFLTQ